MGAETGHYVCGNCGHEGAVTPAIPTPCFRCGTVVDPRASPQVEGSEDYQELYRLIEAGYSEEAAQLAKRMAMDADVRAHTEGRTER